MIFTLLPTNPVSLDLPDVRRSSTTEAAKTDKFAQTFGDGSAVVFNITHSLATLDVVVAVVPVAGGPAVLVDWEATSTVPSELSDTDLQKLEGYLAHKWGVTLDAAHPYFSAPP